MSIKNIRSSLNHLKATGEVAHEASPQYSMITVLNYDRYQKVANQTANEGQTKGKPAANEGQQWKKAKKSKEGKERKPPYGGPKKEKYGEFENILLTREEYGKLTTRFGADETAKAVEELSGYCKSRGKIYADYYATLIGWIKRKLERSGSKPRVYAECEDSLWTR